MVRSVYGTQSRKFYLFSGNCLTVLGFDSDHQLVSLGVQEHSTAMLDTSIQLNHDPISSLQIDQERFLVGTLSGHIHLFDVKMYAEHHQTYMGLYHWANKKGTFVPNRHVKQTGPIGKSLWGLCARNDAWRLMSGSSIGTCSVWNHRTGRLLYVLDVKDNTIKNRGLLQHQENTRTAITGILFDDFYIVAGGMDGMLHIWEPY